MPRAGSGQAASEDLGLVDVLGASRRLSRSPRNARRFPQANSGPRVYPPRRNLYDLLMSSFSGMDERPQLTSLLGIATRRAVGR